MRMRRMLTLIVRFPKYHSTITKSKVAQDDGDWVRSIELLELLREDGLFMGARDHSMLATAYLFCGRHRDALEEFEQISTHLKDPIADAITWNNYSVVLQRLGRTSEAADLLRRRISDTWSQDALDSAHQLLADLEVELDED